MSNDVATPKEKCPMDFYLEIKRKVNFGFSSVGK